MRLQTDPDPDAPQADTARLSVVRFYMLARQAGLELTCDEPQANRGMSYTDRRATPASLGRRESEAFEPAQMAFPLERECLE